MRRWPRRPPGGRPVRGRPASASSSSPASSPSGRVSEQVIQDANDRLGRHVAAESATLQGADGRRVLGHSPGSPQRCVRPGISRRPRPGQPAPSARGSSRPSATLGQRYEVDEICVIRADGLEVGPAGSRARTLPPSPTCRWTSARTIPPSSRPCPLADDAFLFQSEPYISPDFRSVGDRHGRRRSYSRTGCTAGILHFEIPIQRFVDQPRSLAVRRIELQRAPRPVGSIALQPVSRGLPLRPGPRDGR